MLETAELRAPFAKEAAICSRRSAGVGREGGARGARLWRAGRSGGVSGGDSAASDLQIKGRGARQGTVRHVRLRGYTSGRGGQGRLLEVGAPIDPVRREELTADAEEGGDVGPLGAGAGTSLHRQSRTRAPAGRRLRLQR